MLPYNDDCRSISGVTSRVVRVSHRRNKHVAASRTGGQVVLPVRVRGQGFRSRATVAPDFTDNPKLVLMVSSTSAITCPTETMIERQARTARTITVAGIVIM